MTLIKGGNFVTNKQKMTGNYSNLYLVNINVYIKIGVLLLICLEILSRKQNSGENQEP